MYDVPIAPEDRPGSLARPATPAGRKHHYEIDTTWTGNDGEGTRTYRSYRRDFTLSGAAKPDILGSADPAFRGDRTRTNPEELLLAALSSCHMLSFLHLCAMRGIEVTAYRDRAEGTMRENGQSAGEFIGVTLSPEVTLADSTRRAEADSLHERAHALCFIARSVNFPVICEPV